MQNARRKMIEYVKSKGIDITSEFTYKESNALPNHPIFGLPRDHFKHSPMDTLGLIPMNWWCYRMTNKELIETPPELYCGGDTEKAAKYADMAITDMSDNANKMGTDMSSIQNAYQGFAKQNYTMLDNLKLGYGGTKQEMERLLADAEKISVVKRFQGI